MCPHSKNFRNSMSEFIENVLLNLSKEQYFFIIIEIKRLLINIQKYFCWKLGLFLWILLVVNQFEYNDSNVDLKLLVPQKLAFRLVSVKASGWKSNILIDSWFSVPGPQSQFHHETAFTLVSVNAPGGKSVQNYW